VAKPTDSAATLNQALNQGLNLLLTPGVYHVNQTINVTRADTVVLGLGFPTLVPDGGVTPMTVADVNGVRLAGLLFDAGSITSPVLLQVGPGGSTASHRVINSTGAGQRHRHRSELPGQLSVTAAARARWWSSPARPTCRCSTAPARSPASSPRSSSRTVSEAAASRRVRPMDQACCEMLTIQATPNWSTHMPNSSPHACFSSGIVALPLLDSFSQ
jgi:hypothetical protein